MRKPRCPNCGYSFARVIYQVGRIERLLSRINIFPFRCQLCANRFHAFSSEARHNTQAFDRRQYTRLTTSIDAQVLDPHQPSVTNRITDISIDGCSLQATGFRKGAFIELVLNPTVGEETIHIETAMVCSIRPLSIGVRFLEFPPEQYRRLAQVVLGLLVGRGLDPMLNPQ